MIVQAISKHWDKKLRNCKSAVERAQLITGSGPLRAVTLWDFKKRVEFFRPAIGRFIIHGRTEKDDFRFEQTEEAVEKGNQLFNELIEEAQGKLIEEVQL